MGSIPKPMNGLFSVWVMVCPAEIILNGPVTSLSAITDPEADVGNFIRQFEAEYGREHPAFYHGSYSQVRRNLS